jgi:ABC-type phosphate transport system permease subunit
MTLPPALIQVLESVAIAAIGSGIVAPLVSSLKRAVGGRQHTVAVKLPSGKQVRLDLDTRLSTEKSSALIASAVRSAGVGDDAAIERTVDASRAASQEVRAAAE